MDEGTASHLKNKTEQIFYLRKKKKKKKAAAFHDKPTSHQLQGKVQIFLCDCGETEWRPSWTQQPAAHIMCPLENTHQKSHSALRNNNETWK